MEPSLQQLPKEQVEKYIQDWKSHLIEYEKFNNRKAIKEAKKIISELEAELESRKTKE